LGQLSLLAGCIFVERRSRLNLSDEIREITETLNAGVNVTIFPEATSTNGEQVIRFRRPLFQSALDAKATLHPLAINYLSIDNQKLTLQNRDHVFWYGDMTFFGHLWGLFKLKEIELTVTFAKSYRPQCVEQPADLAAKGHALVSAVYRPILGEA